MKISEVIKRLQEIQKEHGDLYMRAGIDGYDIDFNYILFNVRNGMLYMDD